jgi:CHASE1-domain containing sensor protein
MLSKFVIVLALASLAAVVFAYLHESEDGALLEQEVAGQLDALRERLFRR